MLPIKKHLSLKALIDGFKKGLANTSDKRRKNSVAYPVVDTAR